MMYDYFLKFTDKAQADEVLAEYISVAKSNVSLIKGRTSKQKVFEVKA